MRKAVSEVIRGHKLFSLNGGACVCDAARLMKEHDIGCVLVIDGGTLNGIVTKRDIVDRVIAEGLDPKKTKLEAIMTKKPHTCSPDENPVEAMHRMQMGDFRYLPVERKGKIIGVISRRDFIGEEHAKLDEEATLWEHL
ncbi:MAG: CBS domain-containing protein [Rhodospirillales bacterium]